VKRTSRPGNTREATIKTNQAKQAVFHPPYILALDIGTSHIRALLFDRHGNMVPGIEGRRPCQFSILPEGGIEADAEILLDQIFRSIDSAIQQAGSLAVEIAGVATCTFVSNILGIDQNGRPVTPLFPYSDTRPKAETQFLRQQLNETATHQRVGCYFHSSYLPARLIWLDTKNPIEFGRAVRWVSLGEYLWLKLFGSAVVSYSVASWTGLLNLKQLTWDEELLDHLPIKADNLSDLGDIDQPQQDLRPEFSQRWPSLAKVPWFAAIGDGAAANIGSGCTSPNQVAISLGSTSAVRAVLTSEVKSIPEGLWCYRVDRKRSLLGGALTEGGNLFNWLKKLVQVESIPKLESALMKTIPGAHGLTFLPMIAGERSPGWMDEATGTVTGFTLGTKPLDFLQAGLEGMICRILQVYELVRQELPTQPQNIASGGAAMHSPFMLSRLADALGQPVYPSVADEVSARGVSLLALEALGILHELGDYPRPVGKAYQPDLQRHQRFQAMLRAQKKLYSQIYTI
jgi:gluconokinase